MIVMKKYVPIFCRNHTMNQKQIQTLGKNVKFQTMSAEKLKGWSLIWEIWWPVYMHSVDVQGIRRFVLGSIRWLIFYKCNLQV